MSAKMMYGVSLKGFRSALADSLLQMGEKYPNMVVVDAETGTATNVLEFRDQYPGRYVTMGIAEQAALSFAFALSRSGMLPVVPLFSCFLSHRACDQVYVQIGYANANVKMIGCYTGITTPNTGATHQCMFRHGSQMIAAQRAQVGKRLHYHAKVAVKRLHLQHAKRRAFCDPAKRTPFRYRQL